MREVPVSEVAGIITQQMGNGGVFLCANNGERNNTMTIGWGGVNTFFGSPCFLAPVRTSRFTYSMLMKNGNYTVSIPLHDMRAELAFAGSRSAREVDKFKEHGLTAVPAQQVNVPIVGECELHLECTPLGRVKQVEEMLPEEVLSRWYATRDMHTFFLGKIVRCYYLD